MGSLVMAWRYEFLMECPSNEGVYCVSSCKALNFLCIFEKHEVSRLTLAWLMDYIAWSSYVMFYWIEPCFHGALHLFMVYQVPRFWLKQPNHSLHKLTPSLELFNSWFYLHVEVAHYNGFTPHSHGALACLHTSGGISHVSRLSEGCCYTHMEVVESLMTLHLIMVSNLWQ